MVNLNNIGCIAPFSGPNLYNIFIWETFYLTSSRRKRKTSWTSRLLRSGNKCYQIYVSDDDDDDIEIIFYISKILCHLMIVYIEGDNVKLGALA